MATLGNPSSTDTLLGTINRDQFLLSYGIAHTCESYGASPSATAAVNTAAIQSALNNTGFVTITTPGTYLITGSSLVIYSNTIFWVGTGAAGVNTIIT